MCIPYETQPSPCQAHKPFAGHVHDVGSQKCRARGICNDPLISTVLPPENFNYDVMMAYLRPIGHRLAERRCIQSPEASWMVTRENTLPTEKVLADSMLGPWPLSKGRARIRNMHCVCNTSRLVPVAPRNNCCFCLRIKWWWPEACLTCCDSRQASLQHTKLFCSADRSSSCNLQSHCCTCQRPLENFASIAL